MNRLFLLYFYLMSQLISQNGNDFFQINTENDTICIPNIEIKNFLDQKIIELENSGYPFVEVKLITLKTTKQIYQ